MTPSIFPSAPATPIDSLDEVLLTSETWSDYQALQLIETQLNASLSGLTRDERERYLKLCRIEPTARQELAQTIQEFQKSFEELAYAELVKVLHQKTGQTLDLHHTYLHTRMLAVPERQWDKDPIELLTRFFSTRNKRAVAGNAPRAHLESTSLWHAAKENFAFNLSGTLHSGLDFQRASYIDNSANGRATETIRNLSVADFVNIVRRFDFATRLRDELAFYMASTINPRSSPIKKPASNSPC